RASVAALRIGSGHERSQRLLSAGGDVHQRCPELFLQRDAGAVASEREAALDQSTQPPPPGSEALGTVIAGGTTQRSTSSGRTKPRCSAARFGVSSSARASLPIITSLS